MLTQMFNRDPDKRISASEVMKLPWMAKYSYNRKVSDVDLRMTLCNLRNFRTQVVFQTAVLSYIASQKMSQKEESRIRAVFDILDKDKDGQLTKKELIEGLKNLYGDEKRAKKEVDGMFKNIDYNNKGVIEYNRIQL